MHLLRLWDEPRLSSKADPPKFSCRKVASKDYVYFCSSLRLSVSPIIHWSNSLDYFRQRIQHACAERTWHFRELDAMLSTSLSLFSLSLWDCVCVHARFVLCMSSCFNVFWIIYLHDDDDDDDKTQQISLWLCTLVSVVSVYVLLANMLLMLLHSHWYFRYCTILHMFTMLSKPSSLSSRHAWGDMRRGQRKGGG